jgi:hypothetical protein
MSAALRFLSARVSQWWHCVERSHRSYTLRNNRGRVVELGCFSCNEVFWRRS